MTTIDQIKQELRDIIELSDKATPGEWSIWPGCMETVKLSNSGYLIHCSPENAAFVAASRNLTPKMARALLTAISGLESIINYKPHLSDHPEYSEGVDMGAAGAADNARDALETIRREWEVQA